MRNTKKQNTKKIFVITIVTLLILLALVCTSIIGIDYYKNKKAEEERIAKEKAAKQLELDRLAALPKETFVNMSVVGDIMCHDTQYKDAYVRETGDYDFSKMFTDIEGHVKEADIAVGNLETTFAGKERKYSNYPTFNTPEHLAIDLAELGIDVLSTSNNHSMDRSYSGVVSTLDYLDKAGISHTGTFRTEEEKKYIIKEVNGVKFAFLAYTYGTNGIPAPQGKEFCINLIDEEEIVKQLNEVKAEKPDVICVNMHWGIEYQTKQNRVQEDLATFLFENGVDVILGSHPHVLQPMKDVKINGKRKFIIYSLGNFMADQNMKNTRNSIILKLKFKKDLKTNETTIENVEYVPIYTNRSGNHRNFKILDINKQLKEQNINQSLYNTLQLEENSVHKILNYKKETE